MKTQENAKKNFINFWEFLRIPMNSPLGEIKIAFVNKFEEIESSLKKKDKVYKEEDLITCIKAFETLSNPYLRFLHNCEIDGEEPPKSPDWDSYFCNDGLSDADLEEEINQHFLAWLLSKINEYARLAKDNNQKEALIKDIVNKLYSLFLKEQEKQRNKEQQSLKKRYKNN